MSLRADGGCEELVLAARDMQGFGKFVADFFAGALLFRRPCGKTATQLLRDLIGQRRD